MVDTTFLGIDPVNTWPQIAALLPPDYEDLAVAHRQVLCKFGNAKITRADELLQFIFAYAGANLPLRQVVAEMASEGFVKLSAMRLHMKLRQAAPYLQALCQRLVSERADALPIEGWRGLELIHVASTCVVGPSATQAPERLHLATVLTDARIEALATTDPSELDGLRQFFWLPRQVAVASAEAATAASVARATAQGAHVLLDLGEPGPLAFADGFGGAVDARAFAVGLRGDAVLTRPVRLVTEPARRIDGRLVAFKRRGDAVSAETAVFFTTLPEAILPRTELVDVAERAASAAHALSGWRRAGARLSNQRDDTTRAWVYARMLLGLLEAKLADAA